MSADDPETTWDRDQIRALQQQVETAQEGNRKIIKTADRVAAHLAKEIAALQQQVEQLQQERDALIAERDSLNEQRDWYALELERHEEPR